MAVQFDLVRPDDLLNLRVQGVNLRLDQRDPKYPVLVVEDPAGEAFLILNFPPQTIHERAYFEATIVPIEQDPTTGVPDDPDEGKTGIEPPLDPPGHVESRRPTVAQLGKPSRLVFKVGADQKIPYSIAGILDWSGLELSVNPIAAIGPDPSAEEIANAPAIQAPRLTETALELPYRLVISPTADVVWNHRLSPFTHRGRTEMWHTRLQLPGDDKNDAARELSPTTTAPLRAIWSPDFKPLDPPDPFDPDPDLQRTAMSPNDRHQIVILTSAFHGFVVDLEIDLGQFPVGINPSGAPTSDPSAITRFNFAPGRQFYGPRIKITVPYVPQPFDVRQLMLSPLGGWLKSRGHWTPPYSTPPPRLDPTIPGRIFDGIFSVIGDIGGGSPGRPPRLPGPRDVSPGRIFDNIHLIPGIFIKETERLDLSEWVHIATQGRDHYVRIVYEGELWPFRNRAALVKITERKFKEVDGIVGAYMMQRMFIVVREPVRTFGARGLPFKKVRLTTLITPDIASPQQIAGTKRSFWVEVLTSQTTRALFPFHAVGTDKAGEEIDFTIPMMFVSISDIPDNTSIVAGAYNAEEMIDLRQANVPGQKLTFAPRNSDPNKTTDNTQLVTQSLNFVVNADMSPPQMLKAAVNIPQVNELLGKVKTVDIRYFKGYLDNDFDGANGVFAEIARLDLNSYDPGNPFAGVVADTLGAEFDAKQAGGIATPNMALSTLTRELGPVAGKAADALVDAFDPADFFGDFPAFLFGTFDLAELIPSGGTLGKNGPKMTTKTVDISGGKKIITCIDWQPQLKNVDLMVAEFRKDHKSPSEFTIDGCIEKEIKLDGSPGAEPAFNMSGRLTNFQVVILEEIVTVNFTEFGFVSNSGQKTDVTVRLDPQAPIVFGGDLEFVEELRQAIPPDLFGDGPSLDITATGVRAGFSFALPPVAVGVFALKDVTLGAALTLPFLDGKPVFDFNVSERQQPFLLAVGIFGGGGFFRLQLDTAGFKMLEASFEFGATAALDIGVASGEVHIMAGIYFSLQRKEEGDSELTAVLTGYLRMGGSLNVLGLIKVSVEFVLSFTYDSGTDKAYGRATLTVHVEVLFFSASVELTVERAFGGQNGDPKFVEMYDTADKWSRYALAFA